VLKVVMAEPENQIILQDQMSLTQAVVVAVEQVFVVAIIQDMVVAD
jgi:hypothetical protein